MRLLLPLQAILVGYVHGVRYTHTVHGEKRNVVYASRHLDGYCLPECLPDAVGPETPTSPPVEDILSQPPLAASGLTSEPTPAPTPAPTPSPTPTPTQSTPRTPSPECPYFSLDFGNLVAGSYVHDELWYSHGVKITAIRKSSNKGFTPIRGEHVEAGGGAMVFDTAKPTGADGQTLCNSGDGDDDLGAPNVNCGGGPGHGEGGAEIRNGSINPYRNCEPLGNVLVIQESDKTCPDDSSRGGWINFEFWAPTEVAFAKLLDVDEGNTPVFRITYADDSEERLTATPGTGDNGVIDRVIDRQNVIKVSIEYFGSGSIAELNYRFCPPPANCPLVTWDFSDLIPGQYIHDEMWESRGVTVTAIKSGGKGYTPIDGVHVDAGGGAMVFDSEHPTGGDGQTLCASNDGDTDLGSPNEGCPGGGPGVGAGGNEFVNGKLNRFRNCDPLGNVLVIQESDKFCPDDSATGGWIVFDFKNPSSVQLAALLDVDEGTTPDIDVTYGGSNDVARIDTEATGENGLLFQPILLDEVTQISVRYYGSGSISELTYSVCV